MSAKRDRSSWKLLEKVQRCRDRNTILFCAKCKMFWSTFKRLSESFGNMEAQKQVMGGLHFLRQHLWGQAAQSSRAVPEYYLAAAAALLVLFFPFVVVLAAAGALVRFLLCGTPAVLCCVESAGAVQTASSVLRGSATAVRRDRRWGEGLEVRAMVKVH